MEITGFSLMLAATFFWATAQIVGKMALKELSQVPFCAIRFSAVAPVAFLAFYLGGLGDLELSKPLIGAFLSGMLGMFFGCYLFFYLLRKGAAHRIIPVANSQPFWVILLAVLFLGEKIKITLPVSAILIFLGSLLLVPRERGSNRFEMEIPLACFVAFLWGTSCVLSKYCISEGMMTLTLLAISTMVAAISFDVVWVSTQKRKSFRCHKLGAGLSILSGIIGLLVGEFMYLSALKVESASVLAPIMGGTIFFGFLLSVLLLGEHPSKRATLGATSILAGICLTAI